MGLSSYTPTSVIAHTTSVDFSKRNISQPVHIVQYDKRLPILAVNIYNNGQLYPIPSDATVSIRFGKPDKTFVYNEAIGCDSTRTIVYFEITEQMTIYDGEFYPVIEILRDDKIANSSKIYIIVDRNPIQIGDIESTVEFKKLTDYCDEAKAAATEASSSATKAAQSEANSKVSADNSAKSASDAKNFADNASSSATNAAQSEANAAQSEANASTKATEASSSATNAAQSEANAKKSEANASTKATEASSSATKAAQSEANAKKSEANAKKSANEAARLEQSVIGHKNTVTQLANNAEVSAKKSESWAVGGTSTRDSEDTNNSKWYAEQAKKSAQRAEAIVGGNFIPTTDKGVAGGVAILDNNLAVAKAVSDEDGNNIKSTYAKKNEIPEAIEVDSELSTTSMNPVQNKVITKEFNHQSTEMMDIKMLGWSVPRECPIQNEINGNQFIQKVGRVDSGSLSWEYIQDFYAFRFASFNKEYLNYGIKQHTSLYLDGFNYIGVLSRWSYIKDADEKSIAGVWEGGHDNGFIIKSTTYTDTASFKQAMRGQYLYYELTTPITKMIDGNEIGETVSDVRKETTVNFLKPTLETTTNNGVTCTNNGDGTYKISGTATKTTVFSITSTDRKLSNILIADKTYRLVGNSKKSNISLMLMQWDSGWNYIDDSDKDLGEGVNVKINPNTYYVRCNVIIESGVPCNNLVLKPMLTTNHSATYDDFVPYTGDTGSLNGDVAQLQDSKADKTEVPKLVKVDGETITKDENGVLHGVAEVTIDSALSDTSTNPVQNKVIKSALDGKAASSHTHNYLPLSGGALTGNVTIPIAKSSSDASLPVAGSTMEIKDITELSKYKTYLGGYVHSGKWCDLISIRHRNGCGDGNSYGMYLRSDLTNSGNLTWGKQYGTSLWQAERTILDSSNYTSYTVTKTGTGASGSWGISVTGSSASCTGNAATATSAVKLDSSAGSATKPVYFYGGKQVACTYTLDKSVPSNAVFTDTTYSDATTSASGLMSANDKSKLDGIATGANKTTILNSLAATTTGYALDAVQGKALNDAITSLKKSVSDGKSAIASAITTKGVSTASDASFDTMVSNIINISTGVKPFDLLKDDKIAPINTHVSSLIDSLISAHTYNGGGYPYSNTDGRINVWWVCPSNGGVALLNNSYILYDYIPGEAYDNYVDYFSIKIYDKTTGETKTYNNVLTVRLGDSFKEIKIIKISK